MLITYVVTMIVSGDTPAAIIGTATNCEAPAKTSSDMPQTSIARRPACTARPPNTVPYTNTDGTSASEATNPMRTPPPLADPVLSTVVLYRLRGEPMALKIGFIPIEG